MRRGGLRPPCGLRVLELGHSQSSATNSDGALTNLAAFVRQLDEFMLERSVRPRLEGTYGTYLELRAHGREVIVSLLVGSASGAAEFELSGSFAVEAGALPAALEAAERLQEAPDHQ